MVACSFAYLLALNGVAPGAAIMKDDWSGRGLGKDIQDCLVRKGRP